jgi:hypothetical protein
MCIMAGGKTGELADREHVSKTNLFDTILLTDAFIHRAGQE